MRELTMGEINAVDGGGISGYAGAGGVLGVLGAGAAFGPVGAAVIGIGLGVAAGLAMAEFLAELP